MQDIEPYYGWQHLYSSTDDRKSPFYNAVYNVREYENDIYGYYIHPYWDYIGSETLYIKVLYADYVEGYCVIEMFGEWNDTLHNDIMHLKRNVIDKMIDAGIHKFILVGENIFIFHGSDDCYYEEWFDDIEDGWVVGLNFRYFVHNEWKRFGIDNYIVYGGELDETPWRTTTPPKLFQWIESQMQRRLH